MTPDQSVILTGMSMTCGSDLDWGTFGASGECGVNQEGRVKEGRVKEGLVQTGFGLDVATTADVSAEALVVHDAQVDNPAYAFALSRISEQNLERTVRGVE
jgi:hypothetical protein